MATMGTSAKPEKAAPRVEIGGREVRTKDDTCRVRVYLSGTDPKTRKPIRDNITMTLYVKDSKVSDVAKQIAQKLG